MSEEILEEILDRLTRIAAKLSIQSTKAPIVVSSTIQAIYDHYRQYHHSKPAIISAKDRLKIVDRLSEKFTPDNLIQAIDGNHIDPYCCGDNPSGTKYHGLDLIMRDADHVTRYMEIKDDQEAIKDLAADRARETARHNIFKVRVAD